MSLKRHLGIAGFALLVSRTVYPCSVVVIGGYAPAVVRELSGTIVGSGRVSLMGHRHDQERNSIRVSAATISIKTRIDTAFFKKGEVQYPRGVKHATGNLKDWKCGEVYAVKTDAAGSFTIPGIQPGKYCVEITGPKPGESECGIHDGITGACIPLNASFPIDVVSSAPKATLLANISPQGPDCSGGSSLTLRPQD